MCGCVYNIRCIYGETRYTVYTRAALGCSPRKYGTRPGWLTAGTGTYCLAIRAYIHTHTHTGARALFLRGVYIYILTRAGNTIGWTYCYIHFGFRIIIIIIIHIFRYVFFLFHFSSLLFRTNVTCNDYWWSWLPASNKNKSCWWRWIRPLTRAVEIRHCIVPTQYIIRMVYCNDNEPNDRSDSSDYVAEQVLGGTDSR